MCVYKYICEEFLKKLLVKQVEVLHPMKYLKIKIFIKCLLFG